MTMLMKMTIRMTMTMTTIMTMTRTITAEVFVGATKTKRGFKLQREQLMRLGRCQDNRFSKQTQFFFHFPTVGVSRSLSSEEIVTPWEKADLCWSPPKVWHISCNIFGKGIPLLVMYPYLCVSDHNVDVYSTAFGEVTPSLHCIYS